jgi:hypothetical protein
MVNERPYSELVGTKVDVYRNLQTGGYSIRSRETSTYGLVVGHESEAVVLDATFEVSENGRQKVIEQERKNVHAVVRGVLGERDEPHGDEASEVTYNPYKYKNFVLRESESPIESAEVVSLGEETVEAFEVVMK